jgi:hypothetical protein
MSSSTNKRNSAHSAASRIREQIDAGGEQYWKISDFADVSPTTVAQTYSRLARKHILQRVGKGLYYHPRSTVFGNSRPSENTIISHRLKQRLVPAGMTAANRLGFTTQNPAVMEFATSANGVSPNLFREQRARIYTRRPEAWNSLSDEDAALLDFLRRRGRYTELSEQDTKDLLLKLLREPGRFDRLTAVAPSEPARVRAILGAAGQELNVDQQILTDLRATLNRLSRFDLGTFRALQFAREWQLK